MGKAAKEHRKKVQARNRKIEQARKTFSNKFREELLKEIEVEKARRIAEDPEFAARVQQAELEKANREKDIDNVN